LDKATNGLLGGNMSVVHLENGDYLIEGTCVATGEYFEVQVPSVIQKYIDQEDPSKLIQYYLPNESPETREFLISGISPMGWKQIFGDDD
jgi:hypothetical protein